jgi:hypothetical protein
MPYTPEAYAYTPVNYVGKSGSIPALLLYERDGLSYLRFQTKVWRFYDGWGLWATAGIWSEHVVRAGPDEPGIADLLGELAREAAVRQQHLSNCRPRANGQRVSDREIHISKSNQANGQGAEIPSLTTSSDKEQILLSKNIALNQKS